MSYIGLKDTTTFLQVELQVVLYNTAWPFVPSLKLFVAKFLPLNILMHVFSTQILPFNDHFATLLALNLDFCIVLLRFKIEYNDFKLKIPDEASFKFVYLGFL